MLYLLLLLILIAVLFCSTPGRIVLLFSVRVLGILLFIGLVIGVLIWLDALSNDEPSYVNQNIVETTLVLTEEKRRVLDGIVLQMEDENYSSEIIQQVVDTYKIQHQHTRPTREEMVSTIETFESLEINPEIIQKYLDSFENEI